MQFLAVECIPMWVRVQGDRYSVQPHGRGCREGSATRGDTGRDTAAPPLSHIHTTYFHKENPR